MVHLYNFQTAQVGINQIMNSYMDKTGHFGGAAINEDANDLFLKKIVNLNISLLRSICYC